MHFLMTLIHCIDARNHAVTPILHLDIKSFLNLFEALHVGKITSGCAKLHSRVLKFLTIVDGKQKDLGAVVIIGIVPTIGVARNLGLNTTNANPVASLLLWNTIGKHRLVVLIVVVDLRLTSTDTTNVEGLDPKLLWILGGELNTHPGVCNTSMRMSI